MGNVRTPNSRYVIDFSYEDLRDVYVEIYVVNLISTVD